jgi:hypothetical protein
MQARVWRSRVRNSSASAYANSYIIFCKHSFGSRKDLRGGRSDRCPLLLTGDHMFGFRRRILAKAVRKYHLCRLNRELKQHLSLEELQRRHLSRNEQYFFCVHFFDHFLPHPIKHHRHYFSQGGRGFGEDAFHAMWFLIFEKLCPKTALEIGVYRGQTITLWKMLSRHFTFECSIGCVSPFSAAGDSVSHYQQQLDYFKDVQLNHGHFNLPLPEFCQQFSTSAEANLFIARRQWDVIYIDGNHDYEVARHDWLVCSKAVVPGGLIVLDDSALDTDFRPPLFATAGHPGPSRVASEISPAQFREVFSVGHNRVFERLRS